MHNGNRAHGLTTAATIWATAAIGTGVGYGMYILSSLSALIVFLILVAHHLPWLDAKYEYTTGDKDDR
ncbi:MAG: MgtC/SapB family protein [Gammaproteobacteria bacterium]